MSQVYSFRFTRFSTPFLSLCPSLHSIMRRHLQQRMGAFDKTGSYSRQTRSSDAASGWAGWALARQEFGSSVNPIITRGASPPGFENLAASLRRKLTVKVVASYQGHLHTRTKSNSFIFQLKYHGHHKRQDQLALEIRQSKINSRWVAGPIGQTNRRPSV